MAYTATMGYNCPDGGTTHNYSGVDLYTVNGHEVTSVTGTCVSTKAYAGFSQQVINAAWLLKFDRERAEGNVTFYINTPNWDNSDDLEFTYSGYMTQGTFQRQESLPATYYDGYATIDGVLIHMNNGATAALYDYTPHKSGNSNFDTIFTSWFGPVLTSGFAWQYVTQGVYTDSSESTPQNPTQLIAGQRYFLTVQMKNVGSQTWTPNIVHLATSHSKDRKSVFQDYSWPAPDRPAVLDQNSVAPGSTGSFSFWITAPKNTGKSFIYYKEYFQPVADGYAWMTDYGLNWQFDVQPQKYTWQDVSQGAYTDQTESTPVNTSGVTPGERIYLTLSAKNTGNVTWGANTNLATAHLSGSSPFYDGSWLSPSRPARISPSSVAPGQTGTFSFWVQVPFNQGGNFKEYFQPVEEGVAWIQDIGENWAFGVPKPQYTWQYLTQGAYTDATKSTPVNLSSLTPGQRIYLSVTLKNTGNVIWYPGRINLAIAHPTGNNSPLHDSTWMSSNRAGTIASVTDPGQTTTFNFWITTPSKAGSYRQYFVPVADGITWFPDYGLNWQLTVH